MNKRQALSNFNHGHSSLGPDGLAPVWRHLKSGRVFALGYFAKEIARKREATTRKIKQTWGTRLGQLQLIYYHQEQMGLLAETILNSGARAQFLPAQ